MKISQPKRHFASDNNSGVLPEIMQTLSQINQGHVPAYGNDPFTFQAKEVLRQHFGTATEVFFVFNGTAANVLALQAMTKPHHAILCAEDSHINNDECSAPERFLGCKLLTCDADGCILTPDAVRKRLIRLGDQHTCQPKVLSITQPTEYGRTYTIEQMQELKKLCDEFQLFFHIDGSRLVNAAVYLGKSLKEITTDVGADIVSFGGTKNGLLGGEAILILNPDLKEDFQYIRKQGMQLAGKMRFLSSQFHTWLSTDLWQRTAKHSHLMALKLRDALQALPQVQVTQAVESNAVFVKMPRDLIKNIKKEFFFYVWDEATWECRLMTSFDTQEKDIESFINCIKAQSSLCLENAPIDA